MKATILATVLIFSLGIFSFQTKKEETKQPIVIIQRFSFSNNLKNLASAD